MGGPGSGRGPWGPLWWAPKEKRLEESLARLAPEDAAGLRAELAAHGTFTFTRKTTNPYPVFLYRTAQPEAAQRVSAALGGARVRPIDAGRFEVYLGGPLVARLRTFLNGENK